MPATQPPEPAPASAPPPRASRKPPRWIIVGLLVLFAGWFVAMQWRQRGGEPVAWQHDLPAAEQQARTSNRLIFLLLQIPNCPIAAALDRDLFSQRLVREKMQQMICVRLELSATDPLRTRYNFRGEPLMLVLRPGRATPLMRPLEGKIDYLEFTTVVNNVLKSNDGGD